MTEDERQRLIEFLEADQLVSDTSRRLPRATLSPRVQAGLWALRIIALVLSLMVIYTFVHQLA